MPRMPETITNIDIQILHAIQALHGPFLDDFFTIITTLGDAGFVWLAIAALLLVNRKTRLFGLAMLLALAMEFIIVNLGLKNLTARQRPFLLDPALATTLIDLPQSWSFPSGHTGSSFAAAMALWHFPWRRAWMKTIPLTGAALIAFSRLYLGVHYPTDVLFGLIIGLACGIAGYHLAQRLYNKKAASQ